MNDFPTLEAQVPLGLNTGLSGVPYWGADIGGFWWPYMLSAPHWECQELERLEPDRSLTVRDGAATLQIALPLPGVSLLESGPEAH